MKALVLLLTGIFLLQKTHAQNVGIGTNNPTQKLEINGAIKIGNTGDALAGTVRWNQNKNDFEGYNGVSWVSLTGGRTGWGNQVPHSTENDAAELTLNKDQANNHGRGLGVSLSTYGNYMVVGAQGDFSSAPDYFSGAGTVRMFRQTATGWDYYKSLQAVSPQGYGQFGSSVALHGNYMAVGAPGHDSYRGRVYMYELDGDGNPVAMPSLSPGDGAAGDWFGESVALSGDIVVIGGPMKKIGTNDDQGRASVYIRNGNTWQYSQHITAFDGIAGDRFGGAVAIDGNLIAVGSDLYNGLHRGKVYLYRYGNGTWNYETTIVGHRDNERFGTSIFLKGDTVVVGAPGPVGSATDSGKVYVYVRTNNTWQKQATIMPELSNGEDNFGTSVHLYNGYITAGASTQTVGSYLFAGKAYIFRIADGIWHQQAVLVPSNVHTDMNFGRRVSMNGNTVFVTAPEAVHSGLPDHGKLYFFNRQ